MSAYVHIHMHIIYIHIMYMYMHSCTYMYMCIYTSRPKVLPRMENKTMGLTRDSHDDMYMYNTQ